MPFTVQKLNRWVPALTELARECRSLSGVPAPEARAFQYWVDWKTDRIRHQEISALVAVADGEPVGLAGYHRHGDIVRVHYLYLRASRRQHLAAFLRKAEHQWRPTRRIIVEGGPQTLLDEAVGASGFLEAGYQRFERARLERWLDDTLSVSAFPDVRRLDVDDVEALYALQRRGYEGSPDYYLIDDFEVMVQELLGDPWFAPHMSLAVKEGPRLVAALYTFLKGPMAWIASLCVHPDARGRGYGRHLMEHALHAYRAAGFRRAGLHVTLGNAPAGRLYEQLGFTLARSKSLLYVKDGGDAGVS